MRIDNTFTQYSAKIVSNKTVNNINQVNNEAIQKKGESFSQILERSKKESGVTFSKHAQTRLIQRDIILNESDMEKLNSAVSAAKEKGVQNTLVLMNEMAFIVHVPDNLVITAMKDSDIKEQKLFTNIDGTVII
ncbi:MAG: hypothetical protein K0S55_8 [Clostridia bacterium]|jgi:flagellar operon protein|nr:hypothetical protein [Clostridia bacterium]